MTPIFVSEVFGRTLQGEGPSAGRRAVFIRLGLCNLDCAWCDTPYTWDWSGKNGKAYDRKVELSKPYADDVADEAWSLAQEQAGTIAVVTGGEPLVQTGPLDVLVNELVTRGFVVEVETNGTRAPSRFLTDLAHRGQVRFNVSPKLVGSGVARERAIVADALAALAAIQTTAFKFVVSDDDVAEVEALVAEYGIADAQVWLMPEGRSVDELQVKFHAVFDAAIRNGWNASHRLHVLAHGERRGI